MNPTSDHPPQGTAAYFRAMKDNQLDEVLSGGGVGNKDVDGALAEINRRASARLEKIAIWTLLFAAIAAVASVAALSR